MTRPDYVFLAAGLASLLLAGWSLRGGTRPGRIVAASWLCLAIGLLLQSFAPRLQIQDRAVVVSAAERTAPGFNLERYVARRRAWQFSSTLLTCIGALSLAVCYRDALTGSGSRRPVAPQGGDRPLPR